MNSREPIPLVKRKGDGVIVADDLKSLPLPELKAKLESSANGRNEAEAQNRLPQYRPNEIWDQAEREIRKGESSK